jgi:hypothetical protein
MHRSTAFRSNRRPINPFAQLRRWLRRWRHHARLEAIAARFCDLSVNPFLFQIESSR